MDARELSSYAEALPFPILMDVTSLGTADLAWQDFKTASVESMTVLYVLLPLVERKGRRSPDLGATTGPSEATVLPIALDATGDGGNGLTVLEMAAEAGDETAFVQAASEIDWSRRPAADFARSVRLALAAGAHLLARNLADHGHRLHPQHEELAKMARILAPPRVRRSDLPPDPAVRADFEWLRIHSTEYQGQWVALKGGNLVASAPTARKLRNKLHTIAGLFVTRVA